MHMKPYSIRTLIKRTWQLLSELVTVKDVQNRRTNLYLITYIHILNQISLVSLSINQQKAKSIFLNQMHVLVLIYENPYWLLTFDICSSFLTPWKWSCNVTLRSKLSALSEKPMPMNALLPPSSTILMTKYLELSVTASTAGPG